MAFAVTADAAEILPPRIGEKDIGAKVHLLRGSLQAPALGRERGEVEAVLDGDEHVRILGQGLGRGQRADERDAEHAGAAPRAQHEGQHGLQQGGARLGDGALVLGFVWFPAHGGRRPFRLGCLKRIKLAG